MITRITVVVIKLALEVATTISRIIMKVGVTITKIPTMMITGSIIRREATVISTKAAMIMNTTVRGKRLTDNWKRTIMIDHRVRKGLCLIIQRGLKILVLDRIINNIHQIKINHKQYLSSSQIPFNNKTRIKGQFHSCLEPNHLCQIFSYKTL